MDATKSSPHACVHVPRFQREGRIRQDATGVTGIEQHFDALVVLLGGGPQLGTLVVDVHGS